MGRVELAEHFQSVPGTLHLLPGDSGSGRGHLHHASLQVPPTALVYSITNSTLQHILNLLGGNSAEPATDQRDLQRLPPARPVGGR